MYETASMIMGELEDVSYITLPASADLDNYRDSIRKKINESGDGLLILIDLFGGTPFMSVSQIIGERGGWDGIEVVTGMNLGMILETISMMTTASLEELKDIAVKSGGDGIIDLHRKTTGMMEG